MIGYEFGRRNIAEIRNRGSRKRIRLDFNPDVFSYAEDESVVDRLLAQHLQHFGIDFSSLQKMAPKKVKKRMSWKAFLDNVYFTWSDKEEVRIVMEPHNQGDTDTCWTLASTDSLSVVDHLIDRNENVCREFSVQEFMDFTHLHEKYQTEEFKRDPVVHLTGVLNNGYNAFSYVKDNGICRKIDYQYTGIVDINATWDTRPMGMEKLFVRGIAEVVGKRVDLMRSFHMLFRKGPLVGVVLLCPSFHKIGDTLYEGPNDDEKDEELNGRPKYHSILLVGFGSENDTDFFLCKNTYGRAWGKEGFGKIAATAIYELYAPVGTYRSIGQQVFN